MQLHINTSYKYKKITKKNFTAKLLSWYTKNQRALPWRNTIDPYKIWLSEIILQQTRVAQGTPYYLKFIKRFPNINTLAQAEEQIVLHIWQGLGYYSRARNLLYCARQVVQNYGGIFPKNYQQLLTLKGIGKYTAAAIASFAFKLPFAVVDGNVYRVLARIFGIEKDISLTANQLYFQDFAQNYLPEKRSDQYNQAIMEFGAIHCIPKKPFCYRCIFQENCFAYAHHKQHILPKKTKKIILKERFFYYFILQWKNMFCLKKRTNKDIWQGLYDFFLIEEKKYISLQEIKQLDIFLPHNFCITPTGATYNHLLTHQKLYCTFYHVIISDKNGYNFIVQNNLKPYTKAEIKLLPKPVLIENFLKNNEFFSNFTTENF